MNAESPSNSARRRQVNPTLRAFAWMVASGAAICAVNSLVRAVAMELDAMQAQFLRSFFSLAVLLPLIISGFVARGRLAWKPHSLSGQIWRGCVHTTALGLFFAALPHLPLSDSTALGFITPIWVMLGASLILREQVSLARWAAALIGFAGVLVVVGPHFEAGTGSLGWSLVMLASTPFFAASALITKALTRQESSSVIVVWQALTVTLFSAPLAIVVWQPPTLQQWLTLAACGLLGAVGHYAMTRAFMLANISAMQPVRFVDLVWAALFGLLLFGEWPTLSALAGGSIIVCATIWIARREARKPADTA